MRNTLNEQERQQIREMDVETLAKFVFRNLKKNPKTYLDGLDFAFYVDDLGSPFIFHYKRSPFLFRSCQGFGSNHSA